MDPASQNLPRRPLLALATGNLAIGMGSLVIAGILNPLAADLKVSPAAVGQLVTVFSLTYAVAAPLLVVLLDRWNRKSLLLAASLTLLAGSILCAVAPEYLTLTAGRVLMALGAALYSPLASAVGGAVAPPALRGQAIGLVFSGLPVATAFGVPLGTFLGAALGWRWTLGTVSLLALAASVAVAVMVPRAVTTATTRWSVWVQFIRSGRLLASVAVTLLQSAGNFLVFTYLALLLHRHADLPTGALTWVLLGFGLGASLGNSAAARAADRWGSTAAVYATLIIMASSLVVLGAVTDQWAVSAAAIAIWGAAGFGFNAPQQSRLVTLAPSLTGALLSANASALYLGAALGAAAGAWAVQSQALALLPFFGAGLTVLAALLFSLTLSRPRSGGATVPGA